MTGSISRLGSRSARRDQAAPAPGGIAVFIASLVLLALVARPALADMFTISGIAIEASAASPVEAKAIAISNGQARAFTQLVERLTRPGDSTRLPPADANTLQSVVAGYSLDNERTTATDYLADLTVRFNADAVEFLLEANNIGLAVEQAPPSLIVPVLWSGGAAAIWNAGNSWRAVWERLDLDNRMMPALLPLGDSADTLIDADALARGDAGALQLIAGRYGVEFAFVSVVAWDTATKRIEAALTGGGPRGPLDLREVGTIEEGAEAEAMAAIATKLLDRLDEEWRIAVETDPTRANKQSLALAVPFGNLQEWVGVRSRIETTPGVEKVEVSSLNAGGAQIVVTFAGGFREFATALQYQGLVLEDDGTNWVVRLN